MAEIVTVIIFARAFFRQKAVKGKDVVFIILFCVDISRRKSAKRENFASSYIKQILYVLISKGANAYLEKNVGFYILFVNILKMAAKEEMTVTIHTLNQRLDSRKWII